MVKASEPACTDRPVATVAKIMEICPINLSLRAKATPPTIKATKNCRTAACAGVSRTRIFSMPNEAQAANWKTVRPTAKTTRPKSRRLCSRRYPPQRPKPPKARISPKRTHAGKADRRFSQMARKTTEATASAPPTRTAHQDPKAYSPFKSAGGSKPISRKPSHGSCGATLLADDAATDTKGLGIAGTGVATGEATAGATAGATAATTACAGRGGGVSAAVTDGWD